MKQPKMDEFNCADGPYAVVLAPTRELAQQIEEEAIKLAHFLGFKTISVVGGQSIEEQVWRRGGGTERDCGGEGEGRKAVKVCADGGVGGRGPIVA